jgi:hypothetical protein
MHPSPMPESTPSPALEFALQVERLYRSLLETATDGEEPGLGGKLLYAGTLDGEGRALLVAANIAGAASLAVTADLAEQKRAVREGVADFLVTSLDEALRILKNEIRKRETVAVCIAETPEAVEREMRERGVVPDLLRTVDPDRNAGAMLWWRVETAPAQWLPKLDAIVMAFLNETANTAQVGRADIARAQRWLRQSPRYLGRMAHGVRVLNCAPEFAREIAARMESAVKQGQIAVSVEMSAGHSSGVVRLFPPAG